jgi:hypothetical protein
MDPVRIQQELNAWLINFVEKPNPLLKDWPPCPYARQARLSNQILTVFDSPFNYETYLSYIGEYEVVIVCFDHEKFSASQIELFVKNTNSVLMWKDYVILEDHPHSQEVINGVKMNFGLCGLLILQRLSKLNNASKQLQNKGYYDTWSNENLDDVVNWRYIT